MLLATDHVEIHRAELVADAYAHRREWESARLVWSGLAHVQPDRAGVESRSPDRETAEDRLRIWLPPKAVVDSADRLLHRGHWYEVEGVPLAWVHRSLRHVQIRAWLVTR